MALNYSQRLIFPAHTSEDNLRMVGEKKGEGFVRDRYRNRGVRDCFGYGRERGGDKGGLSDLGSVDIIDLLPSDPFGMEIDISTTFTAINGWLEDLGQDYGVYVRNDFVNMNEEYGLFAEINLICNRAMRFQLFPCNEALDIIGGGGCMVDKCIFECRFGVGEGNGVTHSIHRAEDVIGCNHGSMSSLVTKSEDLGGGSGHASNVVGGDPHEAFFLALSYLETKDLLVVERVSRSLCSTIHNDSLLWRSIHIDHPLNERITDDILVQLTSWAEGNLVSLTLIKCPRITDDGLKRVLETNPKLTKLSIPGCTRLSSEGILNNLKAFISSEGTSGIKHIRTGGFYGITLEQFNEVKCFLGTGENMRQNDYIPRFYHQGNSYLPSDDDRDIDVEVCPRCQNVRLVYDCPAESCQVKDQGADLCRACIICIPRCAQCGRCVHNSEYEETFSLEYLCSGCLKELPRCEEA